MGSVEVSQSRRATVWGLISTARINEAILRASRESETVSVRAVASRKAERARAYAQEHDIPVAYGSYTELLEDPEVDVVYISLPNALHIEWTKQALNAGKHVLCEKPLSPRPAEVEEVFELARAVDRHLAEGYMYRHHPQISRLRSLIGSAAIGPLRLIKASFSFPADPVADRLLLEGPDGGSLLDVGCYCVHLARVLCGEPQQIQAEEILAAGGNDLRFGGLLHFGGGELCLFDSGLDLPQRETVEIVCETATISLSDPWAQGRHARLQLTSDGKQEEETFGIVDAYLLQIESFARNVQDEAGSGIDATAADAINQAIALDRLRRAAQRPDSSRRPRAAR
jgi:D-xylose 1-dehydrogenase (NADP+, D-xylono-1,5-lactone-forming)